MDFRAQGRYYMSYIWSNLLEGGYVGQHYGSFVGHSLDNYAPILRNSVRVQGLGLIELRV